MVEPTMTVIHSRIPKASYNQNLVATSLGQPGWLIRSPQPHTILPTRILIWFLFE